MILVYKRIYRYVLCVTVFLEILKETKDACSKMVTWSETEFTHEGSMTRFDKAQDSLTTFMNCPILFDSSRGEITLG